MGLLVDLREQWAQHLRADETSGAGAYFSLAPAIAIYTEKLKSIEQTITNVQLKVGLNVIVLTVIAWFSTPPFKLYGTYPMQLRDIVLADVPAGVAYDVIYSVKAGAQSAPVRPPVPVQP